MEDILAGATKYSPPPKTQDAAGTAGTLRRARSTGMLVEGRRGLGLGLGLAQNGKLGLGLTDADKQMLELHLVRATDGFIRAIKLGRKKWSAVVQQVCPSYSRVGWSACV